MKRIFLTALLLCSTVCLLLACGVKDACADGHSFTSYVSNADATCTEDGTKTAKCERCDATETVADIGSKLVHSFGEYTSNDDATCTEDGTKTAKCERCGTSETVTDEGSAGHLFGEWVLSASGGAGCDTKLYFRVCDACRDIEWKQGSYDDHSWSVITVNPTCQMRGYDEKTCTSCGALEKINYTDTVDHLFENYVSNNNATCTADGTKTSKCNWCDVTDTVVEIGSIGHSFTSYVYNRDATCTADGTKTAKCNRCNATDTVVAKGTRLAHSFIKYVSDGNATCTADGTKTSKCESCDATHTVADAGSKLAHSFLKYSSNNDGTKTSKCLNCEATHTVIDELYATEGLVFTEKADGTYGVTGYTGSTSRVFIPELYNGKAVTSIGDWAFSYCTSLTGITIPDSVTSIGEGAFIGCTSLTSVTIGSGVVSISDGAFCGCPKLVEVINKSTLNIVAGGPEYDYGCVGYYAKEVHTGESKIVNVDDYLFYTYDGTNYLLGYIGENTELVLPESYNNESYVIYNYAFSHCTSLTSVTIPGGVTSIGEGAFCECTSLTSVTIPDSVTSIGEGAFIGCTCLTSVTIPDSVTSIGDWAFEYCTSLTIYCEAESQPDGWSAYWNSYSRPVVWGETGPGFVIMTYEKSI